MELLERFIRQCKADGKSENTIKTYDFNLNKFFDEIGHEKILVLQRDDIEEWKLIKSEEGKSANTINLTLNSLRSLYGYLIEQGKVNTNPCENVKNMKVPKRKPEFMTSDEVKIFLDIVKNANNANKERNYLMMRMFLHCGLRISEVANFKVRDLDFNTNFSRIIGKGNKERFVPVDPIIKDAFEDYMKIREKMNIDSEYLFVSRQNKQLTIGAVRSEVKHYIDLAAVNPKITPHKLRHTFATLMYENEVPLEILQEWLGHSMLNTTMIYAHSTSTKMQKEAQKSPFIHI